VKIAVTQDDIDNGTQRDADLCPIAYASRRGGIATAVVGTDSACGWIKGFYVNPTLPLMAREFIRRFDATGEGRPFVFEIEVAA
jgi:hypothetical protein